VPRIVDALFALGNTRMLCALYMTSTLSKLLTTALAIAYPIMAHMAVAKSSLPLTVAAVAALAGTIVVPGLLKGSKIAWIVLPFVVAGCVWLSQSQLPAMPLFIAPILVPAFLACLFGQSLRPGHTPLIAQFIRAVHRADEPDAEVLAYAHRLTKVWTGFFIATGAINFTLALIAAPDGLLLASGIHPPFTVPRRWWSLFANCIGYLLIAVFFVVEYAYRRSRFPNMPYRNMYDFLRQMAAVAPQIMGRERFK
jgi:uncharacterized membrane protein